MYRFLIAMLLECCLSYSCNAGNISKEEITLKGLFGKLYKAQNDSTRMILNDSICHQLNITLLSDSSFHYAFDSLPYLGKIYSTDKKLRIYSWNYISDAGDYRFFSYFQFTSHKLIRLSQNRPGYLPDEHRIIEAKDWYGALYYNAVPVSYQNEDYYILLGWSRYTYAENFKVIDVLSVKDSTLTFGVPLFNKENQSTSRVTLPYSSGHAMALQFDAKRNLFIFNHLQDESSKNSKIPDESFSGYQLTSGHLIYKEEVSFDHNDESQPHTKVEYGLDRNK